MQVVILAGGLGTRIKEYYPDTIKSLIKFDGIPFIEYQLDILRKNKLTDIVICAGFGAEALEEELYLFEDKEYFNIQISHDGASPLGTGGAIKKALPLLKENFMVLYGDSYLDFNYKRTIDKFLSSNMLSLMTIFENNGQYDKSNVAYDGHKIIVYNKTVNNPFYYRYVDYGANFFRKKAFEENVPFRFDLSLLQQILIQKGEMGVDVIKERFYEIGSIEGINDFKNMIERKNA